MLYDLHQTAELSGLKPVTLQNYARPGYSNLIRGTDFTVKRIARGPYLRRRLYFTESGLIRLMAHDYRVYSWMGLSPSRSTGQTVVEAMKAHLNETSPAKRPLHNYSAQEQRMRLKAATALCAQLVLRSACSEPNCKCPYHAALNSR
jgi:hypothetical protein